MQQGSENPGLIVKLSEQASYFNYSYNSDAFNRWNIINQADINICAVNNGCGLYNYKLMCES